MYYTAADSFRLPDIADGPPRSICPRWMHSGSQSVSCGPDYSSYQSSVSRSCSTRTSDLKNAGYYEGETLSLLYSYRRCYINAACGVTVDSSE